MDEQLKAVLEYAHYLAQAARRVVHKHRDTPKEFLDLNAAAHEFQTRYDAWRDADSSRTPEKT